MAQFCGHRWSVPGGTSWHQGFLSLCFVLLPLMRLSLLSALFSCGDSAASKLYAATARCPESLATYCYYYNYLLYNVFIYLAYGKAEINTDRWTHTHTHRIQGTQSRSPISITVTQLLGASPDASQVVHYYYSLVTYSF